MLEEHWIADWVAKENDEKQQDFKAAIHIILSAIANDPSLKVDMVIKGGILLAFRYDSNRYTKDIDFSTIQTLKEFDEENFKSTLDQALKKSSIYLDYDIDCLIQSFKIVPANKPDATYPSVKISIGYARKGSKDHKRLLALKSTNKVAIDYSLNESMPNIESISLSEDESIQAYSFTDLIAEKLRSVLQQTARNRTRRQDIFDLVLLINHGKSINANEKLKILRSLLEKAHSRGIEPNILSLDDDDIKKRSEHEYPLLASEIVGELPQFEVIYKEINDFYKSFPW